MVEGWSCCTSCCTAWNLSITDWAETKQFFLSIVCYWIYLMTCCVCIEFRGFIFGSVRLWLCLLVISSRQCACSCRQKITHMHKHTTACSLSFLCCLLFSTYWAEEACLDRLHSVAGAFNISKWPKLPTMTSYQLWEEIVAMTCACWIWI